MSYFSSALDDYLKRADVTHKNFADTTALSDSDISRWRRGVGGPPSDKALVKILAKVPDDVALHLCICWLRDETPKSMRARILIQASQIAPASDPTQEDWQQALEFFVQGCEHNQLMRRTLVGLHRLMTKDSTSDQQQQPPPPPPPQRPPPGGRWDLTQLIGPDATEHESSRMNEGPPSQARMDAALAKAKAATTEARRQIAAREAADAASRKT